MSPELAREILSHSAQSDDALRALLSVAGWVCVTGADGSPRYAPDAPLALQDAARRVVDQARIALTTR